MTKIQMMKQVDINTVNKKILSFIIITLNIMTTKETSRRQNRVTGLSFRIL